LACLGWTSSLGLMLEGANWMSSFPLEPPNPNFFPNPLSELPSSPRSLGSSPPLKSLLRAHLLGSVRDWSPHMSFILKGSQISALRLKGWFNSKTSIWEYGNKIQYSYWTCAWIIWYMVPVQCEELRTNYLVVTMPYACVVLMVDKWYRGLQVTSSFSIQGCVWKGCFLRGIFWRAKSHLKGIEDFNLEH
jgi:hypothetical protein